MKWLFLCALGFLLARTCRCADIVAYMPLPFYSHQAAFKPLWLELAKRGHKITLIQCNVIVENNENITHIILNRTHELMDQLVDKLGEGQSIVEIMLSGTRIISEAMEYQLTHPGIQDMLDGKKKVDLFFTEYLAPFGFAVAHKLNVPMIGVVSMDATIYGHISVGNPTHPVLYPDRDLPFSVPLGFVGRVASVLFWFSFEVVINYVCTPLLNSIVSKTVGNDVPVEEIVKNISIMFTNANPLFNVVRPLGPKTINIGGGLHLLEPRPLPKDFQDYLDNAEEGVIYFSLGSSLTSKQLPSKTREVILETFSQLPYKMLWKFDEDIPEKSDNIKVVRWAPQQDVLRHKNVKLFITQGGLQSMEEAIFSYVPMLALPFYGDQLSNAKKMTAKGFGLTLEYRELDVKKFKSAILEILNNPQYRERTKASADLIMDQPMTGLEKAVWWTEYVLRHGHTDHFRDPAVDTPWYQFFLLDVISFLLVIAAVVIYAFFKTLQLVKWLVCKLYRSLTKKSNKIKTS